MTRRTKIALLLISVICGLSVSFITYQTLEILYFPPRGFKPTISGYQFATRIIGTFFSVTFILSLPVIIPSRLVKLTIFLKVVVALAAFIVALRCSNIAIYETNRLHYSPDPLGVIPSFISAVCLTICTLSAAVILLLEIVMSRNRHVDKIT